MSMDADSASDLLMSGAVRIAQRWMGGSAPQRLYAAATGYAADTIA